MSQVRTNSATDAGELLYRETHVLHCCNFSLTLGLFEKSSKRAFEFFGYQWTYEAALSAKCTEGFIEGGLQCLLQTFVQIKFRWPAIQPAIGLLQSIGLIPGKG